MPPVIRWCWSVLALLPPACRRWASAATSVLATRVLQAVASVGQVHLMERYGAVFGKHHDTVVGQLLVVPTDFGARDKYLHARATLEAMLELGVLPIVNENDALADDELRFGDNDRIAALLAQALAADVLVLLTDQAGLLTADPRLDASASLIEDIAQVDRELEALAGDSGSNRGTGGMTSKLAAAKMATWAGVRTVIAQADRSGVLLDAVTGEPGVGTTVRAPRTSACSQGVDRLRRRRRRSDLGGRWGARCLVDRRFVAVAGGRRVGGRRVR